MIKRVVALVLVGILLWISPALARNPILLVPGTGSEPDMFIDQCLVQTLKNAGYKDNEIFIVNFDSDNQGFIQEDIKTLKRKIDEIKALTGTKKVDIIAYSRGGLVALFYTMMYGDQYESTMKYSYIDAKGNPQVKEIHNIPRYGDDVDQIIMIGTGYQGSRLGELAYKNPERAEIFRDREKAPCPYSPAVEQQRRDSDWTKYLPTLELNPDVRYVNIVEDRIFGGDGVISYDSASAEGWWLKPGKNRPEIVRIRDSQLKPKYDPNYKPSLFVLHSDLIKNQDVKALLLKELFSNYPITATEFSIYPESPVREGQMSIHVSFNKSLPSPPPLFVKGNGAFSGGVLEWLTESVLSQE